MSRTPDAPLIEGMQREPVDPCAWLTAGDAGTAMGSLARQPQRSDGCVYTLVIPEAVSAKRAAAVVDMNTARKQLGDDTLGRRGAFPDYESDPYTYALQLQVNVRGEKLGDVDVMRGGSGADTASPAGWDATPRAPRWGFNGRVGHVYISATGLAPDVPRSVAQALAEHVRDRIPDRPFQATNLTQVITGSGANPHPCSLLDRAEAEAVLGPLFAEPYRASAQWPVLAHPQGNGCAYYTAGHHVFTLVPVWQRGRAEFEINQGVGNLLSTLAPQQLLQIKGDWDEAQLAPNGALQLLRGDRLLEIHYLASSTDLPGAVKLAALAARRLGAD